MARHFDPDSLVCSAAPMRRPLVPLSILAASLTLAACGGDATGLVVITQMRPISVIFTVPEAELPAVVEANSLTR